MTSDLDTRGEEVAEELKNHVEMAHFLTIRLAEDRTKALENQAQLVQAEANKIREETQKLLAQQKVNGQTSSTGSASPSSQTGSLPTDTPAPRGFVDKRDALPRPQVQENISASDWVFFRAQWDRYVQGSHNRNMVNEVKADKKESEPVEVGTLTGSWMLINLRDTPAKSPIYEVQDVFTSDCDQGHPTARSYPSLSALNSNPQVKKIRHHIADQFGRWKPSNVQPHGRIQLTAAPFKSAQQQLNLQPLLNSNSTTIQALADTGSQLCVVDWAVAKRMNIGKADLLTPALTVSVADNASLELMGAQFVTLTAATGQTTEQLVYFAKGMGEFYLSKAALIDLEVISSNFPMVGNIQPAPAPAINEVHDGFLSVRVQGTPCTSHAGVHHLPHQGPGVIQHPLTPCPLSLPFSLRPLHPTG